MSTEVMILIVGVAALVMFGVLTTVGLMHEHNARARADAAKLRHDNEMRELTDALRLIRAAIYQRTGLEADVSFLLKAVENHATHLEDLGRDHPMKYAPLKK